MNAPTLHLNGTHPDALMDSWTEALDATKALLRALDAIPLNARDYYPQGEGAYNDAVEGLVRLQTQVIAVGTELNSVVEAISEARDRWDRRFE